MNPSSLLCLVSVLLVSPVFAQQAENNEEKLERFLKRFPDSDAHRDGKLTMEEARSFRQVHRSEQPGAQASRIQPTHADVAYGGHEQQRFDLWLAQSPDGKPTPLCIHIHGGGFSGGDKRVGPGTAESFLNRGISFASLNYRLTEGGKYPYPVAMQDAARGLQFIRSKAKEWSLDPQRIACYGGSAGAGISLWLGFHDDLADPKSDDPVARQSTRIVAAATTNGQSTYDMRTFQEWFGVKNLKPHPALVDFYAVKQPADWETERVKSLMTDASAITHLSKDDVPVFMSYNKGDVPVTAESDAGLWVHHVRLGLKLQEAMQKVGLECIVAYPDHEDTQYGSLVAFLVQKLQGS